MAAGAPWRRAEIDTIARTLCSDHPGLGPIPLGPIPPRPAHQLRRPKRPIRPALLACIPLGVMASRSLIGLALAAATSLGLSLTNPDRAEFERFAADQLTLVAQEELCRDGGLPMLARLVIRDCFRLVASQHDSLGKLAVVATQRRNLGVLSLYRTELGGQQLLPDWAIPRYRALTLAIAGRFLILHTDQSPSESFAASGAP